MGASSDLKRPWISVVGSTNMDLVTYTNRVPDAGETVFGNEFKMGFGGKGANQAVMAALMGVRVQMITCLGSDEYARLHRDNFARYGINTDAVYTAPGSSGVAPIWVEPDGTNRIIVVPGANDALSEADARRAVERVGSVDAVVGQCEVPQPVTAAAFTAARRRGAVTILNPAPATELSSELMSVTDWLIPNEHEMNLAGSDLDDASLRSYATTNQVSVIVTLGEAGVALVTAGDVQRLPAPTVRAIDTTGAGDAFVGAFAFAIAKGMTPRKAVTVGMLCASDSVTRRGAQSSYPSPERCLALIRGVG